MTWVWDVKFLSIAGWCFGDCKVRDEYDAVLAQNWWGKFNRENKTIKSGQQFVIVWCRIYENHGLLHVQWAFDQMIF